MKLTNLFPGTYDFVLLDEARELVRIPEAITVLPLATPALAQMDMQAVGAFVFLSGADAAGIKAGVLLNEEFGLAGGLNGAAGRSDTEEPLGRVLAVKPAECCRRSSITPRLRRRSFERSVCGRCDESSPTGCGGRDDRPYGVALGAASVEN
jgi:hypothetical protein